MVTGRREFRNTFKKGGNSFEDNPLKAMEPGRHTMGLISIKNIVKETEWGPKDCVQFFFLAKDGCSCATHRVTATYSPNSHLTKTLLNMTDERFDPDVSEDEVFRLVNTMVDKWYEVWITQRTWADKKTGKDITISFVKDNFIVPISYDDGPDLPPKAWMARLREEKGQGFKRTNVETETIKAPSLPQEVEILEEDPDEIPF